MLLTFMVLCFTFIVVNQLVYSNVHVPHRAQPAASLCCLYVIIYGLLEVCHKGSRADHQAHLKCQPSIMLGDVLHLSAFNV